MQRHRRCKQEMYDSEREDITSKIINILNLDSNNEFVLYELDIDETRKAAIMALKDDVSKYFHVSATSVFKSTYQPKKNSRQYLSIVRNVLRQQGCILEYRDFSLRLEGDVFKRTQKYKVTIPK